MKSFVYKIIISVIAVILIYEFTIGKQISKYSNQISTFTSKEGRKEGVNKIREEINKGIKTKAIDKTPIPIIISPFAPPVFFA